MNFISQEKKDAIHTRINDLYDMCGSVSPIIYFIDALTKQFNSLVENDCKAFEIGLSDTERKMKLFYNKDGVSKLTADSDCFNHLMVYKVRNVNESEGRYFHHIELANLFIRTLMKKTGDTKYQLSKIFNGYSVCVDSPIFFT